jgi:hypothetical protein
VADYYRMGWSWHDGGWWNRGGQRFDHPFMSRGGPGGHRMAALAAGSAAGRAGVMRPVVLAVVLAEAMAVGSVAAALAAAGARAVAAGIAKPSKKGSVSLLALSLHQGFCFIIS